jgi:hypothetical protein
VYYELYEWLTTAEVLRRVRKGSWIEIVATESNELSEKYNLQFGIRRGLLSSEIWSITFFSLTEGIFSLFSRTIEFCERK